MVIIAGMANAIVAGMAIPTIVIASGFALAIPDTVYSDLPAF